MNKLLVIIIVIVSAGLLVSQQLELDSSLEQTRGSVTALDGESVTRVRGEHVFEAKVGDELRRGEVVKTGESWVRLEYAGVIVSLAENTEVQLMEPGVIKLIGGRVMTDGEIEIVTPWIEIRSNESVSVVNYAWDGRVQILPLGATAVVDNDSIGTREIFLPSQWFELEREFVTDLESFNPKNSDESEFYEWNSRLCEKCSDEAISL